MKKYGLQLRVPPAQKSSKPTLSRPPPPAFAFGGADDEDDIEKEISRHASKNKALQKIEEQHKKAMEEDPSVFDYDGVYDEMKEQIARPKTEDRTERKSRIPNQAVLFGSVRPFNQSKYIEALMEKAKLREREHEIVYERKLLKERSKDDHLYADKEKFVTSAYKKKLAEQAKWLEEERLRQIREERDDVTKKSDLSEFYFGLNENVAFGAQKEEAAKLKQGEAAKDTPTEAERGPTKTNVCMDRTQDREQDDSRAETSSLPRNDSGRAAAVTNIDIPVNNAAVEENSKDGQAAAAGDTTNERYKRGDVALAAARERFLARKRTREQV
ncbi:coiled-coil domain-containing protein 55 [Musa troglodytarum]|uniref:Coiled-coil domain-containing protein 55 n=1 Tax=Musa troglodytarum TaxID=320322 RepID=A0A9E7JES4_9LILI|nr:coiled-coil domain-containing protein 55 [Musa troglodytarum]